MTDTLTRADGRARTAAWARRATAVLHAQYCHGMTWSADCQSEDGGHHARTAWRPIVTEALRTDDPVAYLHDRTCHAQLDTTIGGCPERDRHIECYTRALNGRPDATPTLPEVNRG